MADEKVLIEIDVENAAALEALEKQNAEIDQLEKNNKDLAKEGKKNTAEYQKQAQQLKQLRKERSDNLKIIKSEQGSLTRMRANLAKLTTERNKLGDALGENSDEFKKSQKAVADLNDEIKSIEQASGDFRRNVGNYPKDLKKASGGVGILSGAFESLGAVVKANPLGLILTALTALVAAFTQTKVGAELMEKGMVVVNAAFNVLLGYLNGLGETISAAFTDPKQALSDFADALKQYVTDRVNAVIDMFGFLASAIKKTFSGDFAGALEDAGKAGEKYLEANPVTHAMKETIEVVKEATEEVNKNAKADLELLKAQKLLEKQMRKTNLAIAKQEGLVEKLNQEAGDSTLTLDQQLKAQMEANVETDKLYKMRIKRQNDIVKNLRKEVKANENNYKKHKELLDQLNDAEVELQGLRNERRVAEAEGQTAIRQVMSDEWEQYLDNLADIGERELAILRDRTNNEELTIKERQEALQDYLKFYDKFVDDIQNTFEEAGISEEQFNYLLGIEDPQVLAQAIREQNKTLNEQQVTQLRDKIIIIKEGNAEVEAVEKETTKNLAAEYLNREKILRDIQERFSEDTEAMFSQKMDNLLTSMGIASTETINAIKDGIQEMSVQNSRVNEMTKENVDNYGNLTEKQLVRQVKLNEGYYGRLIKLDNELLDKRIDNLQKQRDNEISTAQEGIDGLISGYSSMGDFLENATQKELEDFYALLDKKAKAQENYEDERVKLIQDSADKQTEIRRREAATALDLTQTLANSTISIARSVTADREQNEEAAAKRDRDYGIASAAINGAVGITKTFAQGGFNPATVAAAAGLAATTAAQIVAIKSAYNNRNSGSASSSFSASASNNVDTTNADNASNLEALQEAIQDMGLTVSVTEINDAQNSVAVAQNNSQL